MNKNWDLSLQVLFVVGLLLLVVGFYFTRISPLQAGGEGNKVVDPYSGYSMAFQFEQEEQRINTQIKVLKADYASNLAVFLEQKKQIEGNSILSELEKREKMAVLVQIYSQDFFQHKLDLIDEQQVKLKDLLAKKCLKFCTYEDLPGL